MARAGRLAGSLPRRCNLRSTARMNWKCGLDCPPLPPQSTMDGGCPQRNPPLPIRPSTHVRCTPDSTTEGGERLAPDLCSLPRLHAGEAAVWIHWHGIRDGCLFRSISSPVPDKAMLEEVCLSVSRPAQGRRCPLPASLGPIGATNYLYTHDPLRPALVLLRVARRGGPGSGR